MRIAVVVGLIGVAWGVASAQPDDGAQKKAAAEAAFRQGKDLLAKGQTEAACSAFKQSQSLDPQFGTQYNLALCYDKLGKLASAWGELTELAAKDTNAARRADADKRAQALEPRLTRVLITAKDPPPGLIVRRDGNDVTAFMNVPTPVDPGMGKITAEAPGYEPWSGEQAMSGEGNTVTVEIPPLEKAPVIVPDGGNGNGNGNGKIIEPIVVKPVDKNPGHGRRRLGVIVASVGVVGLAAGGVFGMEAAKTFDDAKTLCGGDVNDCRNDVGAAQKKIDSASSQALLADIGIGVGAVAVIGGVVLYVTAPHGHAAEHATLVPVVTGDRAELTLTGRF